MGQGQRYGVKPDGFLDLALEAFVGAELVPTGAAGVPSGADGAVVMTHAGLVALGVGGAGVADFAAAHAEGGL
jgi:hypothetical protein